MGRIADRLRGKKSSGWRWVLREIEFRAEPGESWGLIGANGAGKSTLLKILTRVMYPTAGKVQVEGRVGALIEVRAGISPLLTGRENIYLTGTLMGLKRKEISDRFDDIVEFAGLEGAVDRQVKFYSSGMQMRLGFAVAAYLEPDVLLVDEVLAVGDASFQQRCLERMRQVLEPGDDARVRVTRSRSGRGDMCERRLARRRRGAVDGRDPRRARRVPRRNRGDRGPGAGGRGLLRLRDLKIGSDEVAGVRTSGPLDLSFVIESDEEYRAWIYLGISEGAATPIFLFNPGRETFLAPGATAVAVHRLERAAASRPLLPLGGRV